MPDILCANQIREVDEKLLELMKGLRGSDYDLQTLAPKWTVRDVLAHLLDTALRKLAMARDGEFVEKVEIRSAEDVKELVDRLNSEGVRVYRRLSAPLLRSMMAAACEQSAAFHESLDPYAKAAFAVSWAGEEGSLNWFDSARELTERWHHQQQIREATGKPGIMTPRLYGPVLDCFARVLPFAFRDLEDGCVELVVEGDCGGAWVSGSGRVRARAIIPQEIAWRVFTKGISVEDARAVSTLEGDPDLSLRMMRLTAIVG
jgi:uncharacterized protein (TIGR03083 family)